MKDRVEFGSFGTRYKPGWEWFRYKGFYYCYLCASNIEEALRPVTGKNWLKSYEIRPVEYYCEKCGKLWVGA